jgi:FkbM family methyltransferase
MGKVGFQRLRSTSRLFDSCKDLGKRFKRFLERSLRNFSVEVKIPHEYLGASSYGAWAIDPRDIGPQSVVYSFGVGEDVSWDVMMIERFCVQIHAFDPTPKSIAWVRQQTLPSSFAFHSFGVGANDGMRHFALPPEAHWVSYSMAREGEGIEAPVKRLSTIMHELNHLHVDILKMDIEGGEYEVIEDMLGSNIFPSQVLVEFHDRFPTIGVMKTRKAIRQLHRAGYRIFCISPGGDDFSFVRLAME